MRRQVSGVVVALVLLGSGCGTREGVEPAAPAGSVSQASPTSSMPGGTDSPGERKAVDDDLATGRARHVVRSSGITATIDYETRKSADAWTAAGDKPLRVEVAVSRPQKKVYLNRVTLRFAVDDGTGINPGPDPIVDTSSNIVPGYLVAPPYSYVQAFAIPPVDPSTVAMRVDVKLEFVSLVDSKAKDYTKQTITDTVTTAVG